MIRSNKSSVSLRILMALAACAIALSASAEISPGGRGVLYGANHAFAVTAPSGWVLDNQSAAAQHIFMTFYPEEFTWADSPVVVYGQVGEGSAEKQVAKTVRQFHAHNSPNYQARPGEPLKMPNGKLAQVYFFQGDQWGNYEAGIYFSEKETLNFLIFSARDQEHFRQYWPQFQRLAQSYENVYDRIHSVTRDYYNSLHESTRRVTNTAKGRKYEDDDLELIGRTISNTMADCAGSMERQLPKDFSVIEEVMPDGRAGEIYLYPRTASSVCFAAQLLFVQHQRHDFKPYYPLVIDMKFTP